MSPTAALPQPAAALQTLAERTLADRINAALPQTQCTRCGYPDCAAYAQAVASGAAGINQCPPGGAQGIARLAAITGLPELPLSAAHGQEAPRAVAVIDEDWCIGCTLCLHACPTDAILGLNKRMHTVIAAHCTGCELCLPVCPVDCIRMDNASGSATGWAAWSAPQAENARARHLARQERLRREQLQADAELAHPHPPAQPHALADGAHASPMAADQAGGPAAAAAAAATLQDAKRATIAAVLARARAQRATNHG